MPPGMPHEHNSTGYVSVILPPQLSTQCTGKQVSATFHPSDIGSVNSSEKIIHTFTVTKDKPSPELALPAPFPALSRVNRAQGEGEPPFSRWDAVFSCEDKNITVRGICVFAGVRTTLKVSGSDFEINLAPPTVRCGCEVIPDKKEAISPVRFVSASPNSVSLPDTFEVSLGGEAQTVKRTDYTSAFLSKAVYPTWNRCGLNALSILFNSLLFGNCRSRHYRDNYYDDYYYNYNYYPGSYFFDTIERAAKETFNLYAVDESGKPVDTRGLFNNSEKLQLVNTLADSGKSALDIIKNLYGDGCRIVSFEKADTTAVAASTEIKKNEVISSPGDKGIFVTVLRNNHRLISENLAFIPQISKKDHYDSELKKAVEALQAFYGLTVTGIVDAMTWEKITALVNSIKSGSLFDYPGFELTLGANGYDVKRLKNMLLLLKKNVPSIRITDFSSRFDKDTEISLIRAQRKYELLPTGRADRITWERFAKEIKQR